MSIEPRGGIPSSELLRRLEEHDARLAALVSQLEGGAPSAGHAAPAAHHEHAHAGGFSVAVSVLMLLATLMTVSIAVFDYNADPNPTSRRGLMASFRRELTSVMQVGELNAQQRAYADSMLNAELARLIRKEIPDVPAAQRVGLLAEAEQASRQAAASAVFFPQRYLNRDGSFDVERQLGEAWAQSARDADLNARAHFNEADRLRSYAAFLAGLVFILTIALCILELVGNLNPRRRVLRYASVATAVLCMGAVAVMLGTYLVS